MTSSFRSLDRLLRGELPQSLGGGDKGVAAPGVGLVLLVLGLAAFYGACMGAFAIVGQGGAGNVMQVVASAVKVPLLFFLTLLITLPSLYTFNALLGTRLTIVPLIHLMLAALAVAIAVLASIGPIVAFFSVSSTSYSFMVVLNVVVFGASGLLGLRFLTRVLHQTNTPAPPPLLPPEVVDEGTVPGDVALPPAPRSVSMIESPRARVGQIFWIWMILFGLVGMQLAWLLRPFVGSPNKPFEWFRHRGGNFFETVILHLKNLLGW